MAKKKVTKKKTKKAAKREHKPGLVLWVRPSTTMPRHYIRASRARNSDNYMVVCREQIAAIVAPAKLPTQKGVSKAFRFFGVPVTERET